MTLTRAQIILGTIFLACVVFGAWCIGRTSAPVQTVTERVAVIPFDQPDARATPYTDDGTFQIIHPHQPAPNPSTQEHQA